AAHYVHVQYDQLEELEPLDGAGDEVADTRSTDELERRAGARIDADGRVGEEQSFEVGPGSPGYRVGVRRVQPADSYVITVVRINVVRIAHFTSVEDSAVP